MISTEKTVKNDLISPLKKRIELLRFDALNKGIEFQCYIHNNVPQKIEGNTKQILELLNCIITKTITGICNSTVFIEVSAKSNDKTFRKYDLEFTITSSGDILHNIKQELLWENYTQSTTNSTENDINFQRSDYNKIKLSLASLNATHTVTNTPNFELKSTLKLPLSGFLEVPEKPEKSLVKLGVATKNVNLRKIIHRFSNDYAVEIIWIFSHKQEIISSLKLDILFIDFNIYKSLKCEENLTKNIKKIIPISNKTPLNSNGQQVISSQLWRDDFLDIVFLQQLTTKEHES